MLTKQIDCPEFGQITLLPAIDKQRQAVKHVVLLSVEGKSEASNYMKSQHFIFNFDVIISPLLIVGYMFLNKVKRTVRVVCVLCSWNISCY